MLGGNACHRIFDLTWLSHTLTCLTTIIANIPACVELGLMRASSILIRVCMLSVAFCSNYLLMILFLFVFR